MAVPYAPIAVPRMEVVLGHRTIGCAVLTSGRTRRLGLRIAPESGLVVTAPQGTGEQAIQAFLERHRRWVLRWTARLDGETAAARRWPYGPTLLYRGDAHTVLVRQAPASGVALTRGRRLLVSARAGSLESARRILRRWLMDEASRVLAQRVEVLGAQMGTEARQVYVRNLRARWGSCWPGGSLSFNYRLIMAPPAILDYVVVHELAHLRDRSHSPRFWAMVAGHAPLLHEARRWLRTYGALLSV
ncbi:MAG: M48 family metallopeptidase [Candidatus Omnitrophica bacterium]|nr:M48 family metallopeptidase [Candidatus Omnitrophota bacterium]